MKNQFHPWLNDREARQLFVAAWRITQIVFEQISLSPHGTWMLDQRHTEPTPLLEHTTATGLFMSLGFRLPTSLWTPWGEWIFGGSSGEHGNEQQPWLQTRDEILERLTTRVFRPGRKMQGTEYGPVYAVLAVEGHRLPEPRLAEPHQDIMLADATAGWNALLGSS